MDLLNFKLDFSAIEKGKQELADNSKSLLFQHAPSWFDVLDFENDAIFLEPQLFYYFRSLYCNIPNFMTLIQIFYGYLPDDRRQNKITVWADKQGVIYFPNLGYFMTNAEGNKYLEVEFVKESKNIWLNGKEFILNPILNSKYDDFQINISSPPLFEELNIVQDVTHLKALQNSSVAFEEGLSLLKKHCNPFFNAVKATTREFLFFESPMYHSFAALHHFGTSFLNVKGNTANPIFFLEDIAHQSGHVLFYSLTHQTERFLKPNANSLLKDFCGIESEDRTIYSAFHGLFTYTTILHCLDNCYQAEQVDATNKDEILARIGLISNKFRNDLLRQNNPDVFTNLGKEYFDIFNSGFEEIEREYMPLINGFDYSNQDYDFSFEKFQKANQLVMV